jgi:hypothetical protein
MDVGMIGLERLGAGIALRLMHAGHKILVYDVHPEAVEPLQKDGASALFSDRKVTPFLELAHHPLHKCKTYSDYRGEKIRFAQSNKKWSRRVLDMIGLVHSLFHDAALFLGGGDSPTSRSIFPTSYIWRRTTPTVPAASASGMPASARRRVSKGCRR